MEDKFQELKKLKELKDNEILTDEEFQKEKEKILNEDAKNTNKKDSKEEFKEAEIIDDEQENENEDEKNNSYAMAGFILGLSSVITWMVPIFGLLLEVLGIIFSIKGIKSENKVLAIIGLVCSFCFMFISIAEISIIRGIFTYGFLFL